MLFIDTGAFLARYLARDANHGRAAALWEEISDRPCFTSNHVLDETFTLLGRRSTYTFAAARAERSRDLEILYASRDGEIEAVRLFRKFADQKVSFTDCVSFALMRRFRLVKAFSFDDHFRRAGFVLFS